MVASTYTPSVLIADAEPYICRVFEAKLTKDSQFSVVSVSSRADALRAVLRQTFDIVLWDIRLRDTHISLPHLRALCPNAILILTTTDDRPILDAHFSRLDISDILVKPLGLDTLVHRVSQSLETPCATVPVGRVELAGVGQQLLIVTPGGECTTRVLEAGQDYFAVVGAPRVQTPEDFVLGQCVRVCVRAEDALYSFGSRLLRNHAEPVEHWDLSMPRSIRREQRRKTRRRALRFRLELQAIRVPKPAAGSKGASEFTAIVPPVMTVFSDDISLGGVAFTCDYYLPVGAFIDFVLYCGDFEIAGQAVVVRSHPAIATAKQSGMVEFESQYKVALQFMRFESRHRRQLRIVLE